MRVVHVYSGNLFGGVETFLLMLARHAGLAPGLEHRFALCFPGRLSAELADTGASVRLLGTVRASRPWTVARARRELGDLLEQEPVSVAVFHAPWSYALLSAPARKRRLPVALWLHAPPSRRDWAGWWPRWARPDLIVSNSLFTAAGAQRLRPDARAEVIHYPLAPPAAGLAAGREGLRRALGAGEGDTVIIQASRMEAWKGHEIHLRALARLRGLAWKAWFAGGAQRPSERALEARLRALAEALGIGDRVAFLGQRADVAALLAAADVYCQPNAAPEPWGLSFVEALYAKLPVVTSRLGGAAELLDDSCSILLPPGDAVELGRALGALIRDPLLRRRLGDAGPARARFFCEPGTQLRKIRDSLAALPRAGER